MLNAKDGQGAESDFELELDDELRARFAARERALAPQIALMKQFRTRLGLSQIEVAEALSMTQGGVSRIEARDTLLLNHFRTIAHAKGYDIALVLTKDDDELHFDIA